MKKYLLLISLLLYGCAGQVAQAQSFQQSTSEYLAPTAQPTSTPIPSPTIGYQETAVLAQQTAMEAVRVNAQITAEFEQRIQEQLQMTQQADFQYWQVQSWTATLALTSIPLTSTQQVVSNTQIANDQNIIAAQITSTHEAPTQMAAIINIQNMEKYAKMDHFGSLFFKIVGALALLVMIVWFVRNPVVSKLEEPKEPKEQADRFEVVIRDEKNPATSEHYVFPCSEDQLSELAELVMNGERTFGYNRMERTSRTFRGPNGRASLERTRAILEKAKLANNTHTGESVVNDRGVQFFERWFETHELPAGYEFDESVETEVEVV